MIRSLRPGRLLRLGRGPRTARPIVLSHSFSASAHARSSSTNKRGLTINEYKFICKYTDLSESPVSVKNRNPDTWLPFLASCLTPSQSPPRSAAPAGSSGTLIQHAHELDQGHALMSYLWQAKSFQEMDLLVHLGFKLKQWSLVHSLLGKLIDTHEILAPFLGHKNPAANLEWSTKDTNLSLDSLTYNEISMSQLAKIQMPSSPLDLNVTTRRPAVENFGERLLGTVLLNLGTLVLSAADRSPSESKLAMSCVFRTLARLHHLGLISDKVYQYQPADPNQITFRPPGLNLLSSHIMTVLSDAAWLEHEATLANTATEAGEDPPFLPFNVGFRELGPEIWLELILWCCVENGFSKQGAILLKDMTQRGDNEAWKVTSWAPLIRSIDTVRQTDISQEVSWRHPDEKTRPRLFKNQDRPPFNGLGKRTISTEVVASIREMLHNKSFVSVGTTGMSTSEVLSLTKPLNNLLEPSTSADELQLTQRSSNWNLNRMLESGGILPENDPVAFEKLLKSTQNVVSPWEGEPIPTDARLNDITKAQLYDETTAISGLIQQNIRSSARAKLAANAFSGYAWLQSITDASKSHQIRAFFEKLSQVDTADNSFFESRQPHLSLVQSSLPQLQSVVMAELLDIVTDCRAFDFGNWLLFNDDIDGSPITEALYGDQALAPTILRFAAATQNKELSNRVISALEPPLSANTLKSVVSVHIAMECWDRVLLTLEFMRDYRAKSWGLSNISALAAKIIRLDASIQRQKASGLQGMGKEQESLAKATDLFIRLFQGEFTTPPVHSERVNTFQKLMLRRLPAVLEMVPGPLGDILKQFSSVRASPRDKLIPIPTNAFHDILSAVVDVYGSKTGKDLFDKWCLDVPSPSQIRTKPGGVVRMQVAPERKPHQISGDPSFNATWHEHARSKFVTPDLTTFRILAQAAYREFELEETQQSREKPFSFLPASSTRSSPITPPPSLVDPVKNTPKPQYQDGLDSSMIAPATDAEAILDFCVGKFLERMEPSSIELEIPGYMARMRYRGVLKDESIRKSSNRARQIQDEKWMESFLSRESKRQGLLSGKGRRASSRNGPTESRG